MYKKYNMLHLPVMSFFSKRLYRDVGRNWKGANMTYVFLLLAICCVAPTLSLRKDMIQTLDGNHMKLINQLPDIRIKNGLVEVEQEQPYYIMNNGSPVAIIDTSGSMNYIDDANVMALLTENQLIIRRGANQFNTLDLGQVSEFHLNKEIATQWIQMTKQSIAPLSYGIFLLLSYIFVVMLMLLAAVIGLIVSAMIHSSLKFAGVMRISAAAVSPSIILIAVSIAMGQSIPAPVYIAVTMIYLLVGIIVCAKSAPDEEVPKLKLSGLLEEDTPQRRSHAA